MPTSRRSKPLLVGESNPYGHDPEFALYPAPEGCSGHRLCCLILGMRRAAYLEAFDRVNLCDGPWSIGDARRRAVEVIGERTGNCKIILLGSKVCSAFGVPYTPFTVADEVLLRLPHPSGLCRLWREPGAFHRARVAVKSFSPQVAHLLGVSEDGGNED